MHLVSKSPVKATQPMTTPVAGGPSASGTTKMGDDDVLRPRRVTETSTPFTVVSRSRTTPRAAQRRLDGWVIGSQPRSPIAPINNRFGDLSDFDGDDDDEKIDANGVDARKDEMDRSPVGSRPGNARCLTSRLGTYSKRTMDTLDECLANNDG